MSYAEENLASLIATGCSKEFVASVKRVVMHLLRYDPQVYMLVCSRAQDVVDARKTDAG
jgi:hypothetical protein